MKKYVLLFTLTTHIFITKNIYSCPCELSPHEKRPFFEQFEENQKEEQTVAINDKEKEVSQ